MDSIRFRAASPDQLAEALLDVVEYARTAAEHFVVSPISLRDLDRDGLLLEGDITGVVAMLRRRHPGLVAE